MTRREILTLPLVLPALLCEEQQPVTLQQALTDAELPPVVTISIGPQWEKTTQGHHSAEEGGDRSPNRQDVR